MWVDASVEFLLADPIDRAVFSARIPCKRAWIRVQIRDQRSSGRVEPQDAVVSYVANHYILWQVRLVPHTGCLFDRRMRLTALSLDVLESHGQHGSILIRVQTRVQTSKPEPGGHLRWADDYVSGSAADGS